MKFLSCFNRLHLRRYPLRLLKAVLPGLCQCDRHLHLFFSFYRRSPSLNQAFLANSFKTISCYKRRVVHLLIVMEQMFGSRNFQRKPGVVANSVIFEPIHWCRSILLSPTHHCYIFSKETSCRSGHKPQACENDEGSIPCILIVNESRSVGCRRCKEGVS